jgi:hypothetical protein
MRIVAKLLGQKILLNSNGCVGSQRGDDLVLRRFARYQRQGNFDSASDIRRKPINPFE